MKIEDSDSLLRFMASVAGRVRLGLFLAIMRSFCIAPLPWLFGVMIERHVPSGNNLVVMVICWICVGLLLVHTAFSVSAAYVIGRGVTSITKDLRSLIFTRLQFLSFTYLDKSTAGRLLSKYAFDTQKVQDVVILTLNQLVPNICYGIGVTIIMVVVDWKLATVVLLILPVVYLARAIFKKRIKRRNHEVRVAQERLTGNANEMISALRLVRSFGEEEKAESRLHHDNSKAAQTRAGLIGTTSVFGTFLFVSNQIVSLVVVAVGSLMVINGHLSIGVLFAFVAALPIVMAPFQMITQFIEQYAMGQESYQSVRELIACPSVESWQGTRLPNPLNGEITFRNVQFAYPGKEQEPVLSNFDLQIRAGEQVALVGASGSGKSTIANLILGLYQTTGGAIEIDGVPQHALDMRAFRQRCAIVMQENILLSGSVMENIRFARSSATDEEVIEAARAANAEDFINNLPEGYETTIGERGVSLSGGQRQRLSIARALLRNPRILILDEATSALDNRSEALIQQALENLARDRTVITIAHRLTTIRKVDRVIVLGNGKILEQGRFDELAVSGGVFAGMLAA